MFSLKPTVPLTVLLLTAHTFCSAKGQSFLVEGTIWAYAQEGNTSKASQLLARNPQLVDARYVVHKGTKDEVDWTPLTLAATAGQVPMMRLLLSKGASVNLKRSNGHTTLYDVIIWGSNSSQAPKVLSMLISAGANVNERTPTGFTPLDYTTDAELARVLLDNGALINDQKNARGITPLHAAIKYGLVRESDPVKLEKLFGVAKLLIDRHASLNVRDKKGFRALDYARKILNLRYRQRVVNLLVQHGAKSK